jgi:intein/homing endonuclease
MIVTPGQRDPGLQDIVEHFDHIPGKYKDWDQWTPEQRVSILKKSEREARQEQFEQCADQFEYAARNYFWITNKSGQDQLFTLWESQALVLAKYHELKRKNKAQKIMILKGRQLGCSLLIESMIAWRTMFFPNTTGLVVSVVKADSAYLFSLLLHIYDHMPWWLKPELASREEQDGLWFDRRDPEMRAKKPGMNSRIYVQHANQVAGVGQGKTLRAAHLSEFTDITPQSVFEEIIEGDLLAAIADNPEAFCFLESTGRGAGTYSHDLWKGCVKRGERAEFYPMFLPYFFETTRVLAPPNGWHVAKPEAAMRERVRLEWVRCDKCKQYHTAAFHGESRLGTICPACDEGKLESVILSDPQLYWKQVRRENAEDKGKESVKKHLMEMACVVADTRVSTNLGVVRIYDAQRASSTETGVMTGWYDQGFRDVVSVETYMGRQLICTHDQELLLADGRWAEALNLKAGDELALSPPKFCESVHIAEWAYSPRVQFRTTIDATWARFLGYWAGDGCWKKGSVNICCDAKDQDVVADVCRVIKEIIGNEPRRTKIGNMTLVSSNDVRWFQILFGLGVIERWSTTYTGWKRSVCVPDCIWASPKEIVREFLSALFECDGHAASKTPRTGFFAKSTKFMLDIQLLCLGFGLNGRIKHVVRTLPNGRKYPGNQLWFNQEGSNLFHEMVGFIGARKRGACQRKLAWNRKVASLNRMVDHVVSIKLAGRERVYDLEVADAHRYGANGLMIHNCTAEDSWQLSGMCVFDEATQAAVSYTIRDPAVEAGIKVGFIDSHGRFHGQKGERGCWVDGCTEDHRFSDENFTIWEDPIEGYEYTCGVDISEGLGQDDSAICVNKIGRFGGPDEQVAMWRSNSVEPYELAFYCNVIGRMYNNALMCIEYNIFTTTGDRMRINFEYPNLFRWLNLENINPLTNKWHWYTDYKHKPLLWQTARHWLKVGNYILRDPVILSEMKTFQKDEDDSRSASHDRGSHDDSLMSSMIALYCSHAMEADPSGRIPVQSRVTEQEPPRYRMWCASCQFGKEPGEDGKYPWGVANPEDELRCPQCSSIHLRSLPLENPDIRVMDYEGMMGLLQQGKDRQMESVLDKVGSWAGPRERRRAGDPNQDFY